ncbi:MAG: helix-turn-helix domain-containing protein [Bacteroidetes bacterium]|nr:MAG: helix-turn-helix domain-containing protein [Bacteroidota bacterium]MBL1143759.1 helix-turn-helix domain-containing protein [Bacteroidota bacterium]MCB0802610.1 helix-turn-helix domain-containing protein [Flavobacteriales bacterium]NOG56560.1 helix-turn-helix domain-containing protein [Bacteroidota bacterium]
MDNFFSINLKFLRKSKGLTQGEFASKIGINRPKIGSYEEGRAEPNMVTLQNISHFFKIKLDDLIEKDLAQKSSIAKKDFEGNDLRILPIVVDDQQIERITLVPIKAAAGYLNGYADPEFIETLPRFNLPLNEFSQGTYRAFQINGDSMHPIPSGSYILAEYIENWKNIKDNHCYVLITKDDGLVYKRVVNHLEEKQTLELHSDNSIYETYTISGAAVLEVWKAKAFLSFDLPQKTSESLSVNQLTNMMLQLKDEVNSLKKN